MNQSSTIVGILINYLILAPIYIVWGRGFILAKTNWHKHHRLSRLTIIALAIFLLESLVNTYINFWLPNFFSEHNMKTAQMAQVFALRHIITTIIIAVAWGILISAIFGEQKKVSASNDHPHFEDKKMKTASNSQAENIPAKASLELPDKQSKNQEEASFTAATKKESDNLGTRFESYEEAWGLMMHIPPEPKLVYIFHSTESAKKAFLDLPFIFLASDSGKMISTEPVAFGFYEVRENLYHAVIIGNGLTYELWDQAKKSFIANGGRSFGETEPPQPLPNIGLDEINKSSKDVVFVKEYEEYSARAPGAKLVKYTVFKADNKQAAMEWLSKNAVNENFHYVIVETPEGNFGRDAQGIYQE